ncbi:hypothetical protein KCP71_00810 [Salmonella enterica subsp. enterica]|nr:hypothetical protein KCP71_00810 [Salmonella enterica subsp. enterica]
MVSAKCWSSSITTRRRNMPYMAHRHLLEHEDTGMMLGFTV